MRIHELFPVSVFETMTCLVNVRFSSFVCILREGTDSFFELKQIEGSVQASAYFVLALSRYRVKGLSDVLPT